MTIPQRLRFLVEVAGRINKHPLRKDSSLNRSRLSLSPSIDGSFFSNNRVNKTQRLKTELLCLRLFRLPVRSHTCVNLSYFTVSSTSLNSKKQFRGIPRCHNKTGLRLAERKRDSFFWNCLFTGVSGGTVGQSQGGMDEKRARPDW